MVKTTMEAFSTKAIGQDGESCDDDSAKPYACYAKFQMYDPADCVGSLEFYQISAGQMEYTNEQGTVVASKPAIHATFCQAHSDIGKEKLRAVYKSVGW